MATLDDSVAFAVAAHRGHRYPTDEIGREPFILHPLRVMLSVSTDDERVVAVLHDVIEESETTLDDLRRLGLSDVIIEALDLLTHRDDQPYEAYIERLSRNCLARSVKIADLRDNLGHNRGFPGGDDVAARHRAALSRLSSDQA
jgi:(p)ppGpp synthase/HD superfamily hydrolase